MTKLQAIAKMLFFVIGVSAFTKEGMIFMLSPLTNEISGVFLSLGLLWLLFNWAIAYFLIFKSDKFAVKLGKFSEEADDKWVVTLFTAAAIFAGGLLLAGCIRQSYVLGDLFKAIAVLPSEISRWVSGNEIPTLITIDFNKKMQIVAWLIKTAVVLYLMFGMKRFVRWQISKLKSLNLVIEAD